MPARKDIDAITVSFSKKNSDVWNILNEKKKNPAFVQNDYICEAIRFYEKNKNRFDYFNSEDDIKKIVDARVDELLNNGSINISKKKVLPDDATLEEITSDIDIDDD